MRVQAKTRGWPIHLAIKKHSPVLSGLTQEEWGCGALKSSIMERKGTQCKGNRHSAHKLAHRSYTYVLQASTEGLYNFRWHFPPLSSWNLHYIPCFGAKSFSAGFISQVLQGTLHWLQCTLQPGMQCTVINHIALWPTGNTAIHLGTLLHVGPFHKGAFL